MKDLFGNKDQQQVRGSENGVIREKKPKWFNIVKFIVYPPPPPPQYSFLYWTNQLVSLIDVQRDVALW